MMFDEKACGSPMRKRTRLAIATGLAMAMMAGTTGLVSPPMALAETGSLKITQTDANANTHYVGYRLFKAGVTNSGGTITATSITWDDDTDKAKVTTFLAKTTSETGASQSYADWMTEHGHSDANDPAVAAEYISAMISGSASDATAGTTPRTVAGDSFAARLARHLSTEATADVASLESGVATDLEQGYYLFKTSTSDTGVGEVGTAPIWVAVSGSATQVTEKASALAVEKQVMEDSTGTWGDVADAHMGQDLRYRIIGTLPANYGAYETYSYSFKDTLPSGMQLREGATETSSVAVTLYADGDLTKDGTDVTGKFDVSVSEPAAGATTGKLLTVSNANLHDATNGIPEVTGTSKIVVTYEAHLAGGATIGGTGNTNSAVIEHSNDPVAGGMGQTVGDETSTYAYQLVLEKVDKDTRATLAGAKFTIWCSASDGTGDAASAGKYVQADGSLGTAAYEHVTGVDGKISVGPIDRGTYVIHESAPPAGHDPMSGDISITIGATLPASAEGTITTATMSYSGGMVRMAPSSETAYAAADGDGIVVVNGATASSDADGGNGVFSARVSNPSFSLLPGTGLTFSQAEQIAGAILLVVGLAVVAVSRRRPKGGASEGGRDGNA